jgi:hypothetical protein
MIRPEPMRRLFVRSAEVCTVPAGARPSYHGGRRALSRVSSTEAPNSTLERPAGSHALAAAAQRERSAAH